MSRRYLLVWRLIGAMVGAVAWPFLLPLGTASIPLSRWLAYDGWSAVLGWFTWAAMGALVEALLAWGVAPVVTLLASFTAAVVGFLLLLLMEIPVFDEPWTFLDPAIVTFPLAFGAAALRLGTLAVTGELRRWRLPSRGRLAGARLLCSIGLLLLALLLTGWLVKLFFWDLLPSKPWH